MTQADYIDEVIGDWNRELPELNTAGLAILGRIFALFKHVENRLDRVLRAFGLPLWGFDVLFALRRSGHPYTLLPTQLMKACFLTSGAMTHRLDRLESQGYLERAHATNDRRSVNISLTLAGRELVERAMPARVEDMVTLVNALSGEEQASLAGLLRKLLVEVESLENF